MRLRTAERPEDKRTMSRRQPGIAILAPLIAAGALACAPATPKRVIPPMTLQPDAVTIDAGALAKSVAGTKRPPERHEPNRPPFMNGVPEHLRYAFDGETLDPVVHYRQRQLLVYPLESYRQIHEGDERAQFDQQVGALKTLIDRRGEGRTDNLLVLPPMAAGQVFAAQVKHLEFRPGAGIRYVTRFSVTNTPTTNEEIFYTFQGITSDGQYYVSLFWPVSAKDLPPSKDFVESRRYIDALAPADFTPPLDALDAMVRSIAINTGAPPKPAGAPGGQ